MNWVNYGTRRASEWRKQGEHTRPPFVVKYPKAQLLIMSQKDSDQKGLTLKQLFEVHFGNYYEDKRYLEILVRTVHGTGAPPKAQTDLIGYWVTVNGRRNVERRVVDYCRILPEDKARDNKAILAFTLSFAERNQKPIYVKEAGSGRVYAATYIDKTPVQVSRVLCEFDNYHVLQIPSKYTVEGFTRGAQGKAKVPYTSPARPIQLGGFVAPSLMA